MKARKDAIIRLEQAEYLDRLHPSERGLVEEMEVLARERGVPIADREVARFLEITARATGANRVLEIGMAIGYSALHLARALPPSGMVVTIEPDEEMIRLSEGFLTCAGLRERVRIERGYALDVMPRLGETFDIVFLDAIKEEYGRYLELALTMLRVGGLIIADNLLWGGEIAGDPSPTKGRAASAVALRSFNREFVGHPRLLAQVLPVGDGLGYAVKIS